MTIYKPGLNIKTGLLFIVLLIPELIFSQSWQGQVLSSETNFGIGFVNVGIIGRNIGTVSDESGNFTINLDNIYDNDSIRFSMIGYESKSFLVGNFKENSIRNIYLSPRSYFLTEVKVFYHKAREIRLGAPVISNTLKSGFSSNDLGSELGINVNVKKQVILKNINFNVATCTFDSVTYRLNIYQLVNTTEFKNILTEPIYISFSKDKINKVITFDLRKYSIMIEGNVLITLELYKDLGEGSLLFHTQFFTGSTYHRKTSEGKWTVASGVIGMYLYSQTTK
jgi:CarboxypepD_reg-like domain